MNIDLSINTDLVRDILTRFIRSEITDRKSTRLNSSHLVISYAVFCLKKKKNLVECVSRPRTARLMLLTLAVIGLFALWSLEQLIAGFLSLGCTFFVPLLLLELTLTL